jgi:uncharacterized protein YjiS (DUF1127 family)
MSFALSDARLTGRGTVPNVPTAGLARLLARLEDYVELRLALSRFETFSDARLADIGVPREGMKAFLRTSIAARRAGGRF